MEVGPNEKEKEQEETPKAKPPRGKSDKTEKTAKTEKKAKATKPRKPRSPKTADGNTASEREQKGASKGKKPARSAVRATLVLSCPRVVRDDGRSSTDASSLSVRSPDLRRRGGCSRAGGQAKAS